MRIVHIAKVKGIAGAERHLITLLPALRASGFDVRMLVLEDPRVPATAFREALAQDGIAVDTIAAPHHVAPGLVGRIARMLRKTGADVVHTHMFHADVYGLRAARRAGVRAAVSSRHDNMPFRRRPHYRYLTRRTLQLADRIITISHALARFVTDIEGIDAGRVTTIHYGFEADVAPASPPPRAGSPNDREGGAVVGSVCRLVPQKGVDVLIDAFPLVLRRHPRATLIVAGDGPERAVLERRAATAGLGDRVVFTGWTNHALDVMAGCDVVAMPSRWEGFGHVALEAMRCARPVVASRVDAIPEVVQHEQTGLLVPADDPEALADAIATLFDRPAWAAALGAAGRDRLRTCFSVERMVHQTADLYRRLPT